MRFWIDSRPSGLTQKDMLTGPKGGHDHLVVEIVKDRHHDKLSCPQVCEGLEVQQRLRVVFLQRKAARRRRSAPEGGFDEGICGKRAERWKSGKRRR